MKTGGGIEVERPDGRVDAVGQAGAPEVLLDRGDGLVEVGAVVELGDDEARTSCADVDWSSSRPRHAGDGPLDRLGHLLGDVGGAGARVRRDDRHDRERDVRQELLLEAAPGEDAGDEEAGREQERHAALADGELAEAAHSGSPGLRGDGSDVRRSGRPRSAARRHRHDPDGALDDREVLVAHEGEQGAELARC